MEPKDVLPELVKGSGRSMRTISVQMDRTSNYLAAVVQRKSIPKYDTMAEIADVCGYDLLLRRRDDGTEIIIDPPRKE